MCRLIVCTLQLVNNSKSTAKDKLNKTKMCAHITKTMFITQNAFNMEFHSDFRYVYVRILPRFYHDRASSWCHRCHHCESVWEWVLSVFRSFVWFGFVMLSFQAIFAMADIAKSWSLYINLIYILYCSLTHSRWCATSCTCVCLCRLYGVYIDVSVSLKFLSYGLFCLFFFVSLVKLFALWVDVSVEWNCIRAAMPKQMTIKSNKCKKRKKYLCKKKCAHRPTNIHNILIHTVNFNALKHIFSLCVHVYASV